MSLYVRDVSIERIGAHLGKIIIKAIFYITQYCTDGQSVTLNKHLFGTIPQVIGILVGGETTNAVTVERYVGVEIQSPVFGIYGIELTGKFDTFVRHMAEVGPHIGKTSRGGNRHVLQQISGLLIVVVHREGDTVFQETEVQTYVILVGSLPFQIFIQRAFTSISGETAVGNTSERIVCRTQRNHRLIAIDTLVTGLSVTGT